MKAFEFIAINSSGKKKVGTVKAWSLAEAKRKIQRRGLYVASIKIQDSSVGSGVAIQREGSRGTSPYSQSSFSFFNWIKEALLLNERIEI